MIKADCVQICGSAPRLRTVVLCAFFLSLLSAQWSAGQDAAPVYASTAEALLAFNKSSDASVREAAYAWMKDAASKAPPSALHDSISKAAPMAHALGLGGDFASFCAGFIDGGNPDAVVAALSALSDF